MIIGVDTGTTGIQEADTVAGTLSGALGLPPGVAASVVVATHTVQVGTPHFALSVTWPDGVADVDPDAVWESLVRAAAGWPAGTAAVATWDDAPDARTLGGGPALEGAWTAVARLAAGQSGRVVVFPRHDAVHGDMAAREILAVSGVDEVRDVSGAAVDPGITVRTGDFARPRWRDGSLVLQVQAGPDGTVVPFEKEHMEK